MTEIAKSQKSQRFRDKSDKGYHKLIIWQKAKLFVSAIYAATDGFPKAEEFGLKGQIRRATVSIVLNIVEGYRRRSTKDFLRFLDIAQAFLAETEACLEIALDLNYFSNEEYEKLEENRCEIGFILNSFIKSLRNKV